MIHISQAVWLAFVGGIVLDVLNLAELRNIPRESRPDLTDFWYWFPPVVFPFLGALLGYLYDDAAIPLSKIVAFQLGLSAPLILKSIGNAIPNQITHRLPPGA